MAKIHSRNAKFKWNGIELSDDVKDTGLARSAGEADITTLASTAKEFLVGLSEGTIDLSGFWGTGASEAHLALAADFAAGTSRAWSFGPGGVGVLAYDGNGYLTKYDVTAAVDGAVEFAATIRVTGAVTYAGTYSAGT